ncbi:MAG TPA: signal peptidase I, partial [Polyangiaceae bacterium]|nr:signal peptidase I [Polyangiaceae bacterium]
MEGVFQRMALVALMGCVACAAAPPAPQPVVPSKAPSAPVPSPAVTSSFAARAPEHTRLLLAMDLNAMIDNSKLRAMTLLMPDCKLDLAHDVERIEVAVSEPAEIRIDLSGTLSVATAQCVLDALTERGLLPAGDVRVAPLAHGVRLATERALVDGPAASSDLTRSFDALAMRSKNVLVSDLAPGGKYELWSDGAGAITLRTALHSAEQALAAAEWTQRALASEPTAELRDIDAKAEGAALTLFLPNPSERRALLLRQHVIEAFRVPSGSMLPTLLPGDHLFVVKGPSASAPQRGDIVVFRSPREPSMDYVKRVIG